VPPRKKQSFESALDRLEKITRELESGELDLDGTVKRFEEAMELARFCSEKLSQVEKTVARLAKKQGEFMLESGFTAGGDDSEE